MAIKPIRSGQSNFENGQQTYLVILQKKGYVLDKNRLIIKELEHSSEILLYQTANGETKIDVRLEDETVWLNQKQMADLYNKNAPLLKDKVP